MSESSFLDYAPLWLFFLLNLALTLGAVEGGYRWGLYRWQQLQEKEPEAATGTIVAATLGLLAFLLAFTFNMAGSRFDERRELFQQEVNAIGTAYLRAPLLPDNHGKRSVELLRQYVDIRAKVHEDEIDIAKAIKESEKLHGLLWAEALAAGQKAPNAETVALYIVALNEVIDLHSTRVTAALRARIPSRIWLALFLVAGISMVSMGYHAGLVNSSRPIASIGMALCFVITMQVIVDLDRPLDGLLRVDPQALLDLRDSMKE